MGRFMIRRLATVRCGLKIELRSLRKIVDRACVVLMGKTARNGFKKVIRNDRNQMEAGIKSPQENGVKVEDGVSDTGSDVSGKEAVKNLIQKNVRHTRSRSHTPQNVKGQKNEQNEEAKTDKKGDTKTLTLSLKKADENELNGHDKEEKTAEENLNGDSSKSEQLEVDDKGENIENESKNDETNVLTTKTTDSIEMDPLVLASDEPDPELEFDENSDRESGKGSPVIARCTTRRSLTRNIPTPKTPKLNDSDSEKTVAPTPTPDPSEVDSESTKPDAYDSIDVEDVSIRASAGNDSTRLEYIAHHTSNDSEDSSYFNTTRERSLRETLRGLTPRKTIRPLNDSYRQKAIRNNQNKSELNVLLTNHEFADRISGLKRKSRNDTPDGKKRFKTESSGIVSYLSSPLNSLKNRLKSDVTSSTPKLTGYKDSSLDIHDDISLELVPYKPVQEKRNWCSLM